MHQAAAGEPFSPFASLLRHQELSLRRHLAAARLKTVSPVTRQSFAEGVRSRIALNRYGTDKFAGEVMPATEAEHDIGMQPCAGSI